MTGFAAPWAVPVSGEPFEAELVAVDADWQLTFQTDHRRYVMQANDLVYWGRCPGQGRAGGLVLRDGGWIPAEPTTANTDTLTADSELFGKVEMPLGAMAGAIFHAPSDPSQRDALFNKISPLPLGEGPGVRAVESSDRLLLNNGDELTGRFLGLADDAVRFQTDLGPIDVETGRVTALILQRGNNNHQPAPFRAWTAFRDGARLPATQLTTDGDTWQLTTAGQKLAVPRNALVFLQPLGGRVVYLSDLEPVEYQQTPYLDLPWPWQADRSVAGGFLRCNGQLYLKGLGVHSASRLVYQLVEGPQIKGSAFPLGKGQEQKRSPLPLGERREIKSSPLPLGEGQGVRAAGAPQRFEAELALDDTSTPAGSVQYRVLVDGQEKYVSPTIRAGQSPAPISVDVAGAKKLELIVDYADRADVLDRADWLNARLTRKGIRD